MIRELKPSKKRTEQDRAKLRDTVGMIIDSVVKNGDEALLGYNARFDGCLRKDLRISRQEIDEAYGKLSTEEIDDIKKAASNIRGFAKAQKATIGELSGFRRRRVSCWAIRRYRWTHAAAIFREADIPSIRQL